MLSLQNSPRISSAAVSTMLRQLYQSGELTSAATTLSNFSKVNQGTTLRLMGDDKTLVEAT